MISSELPEILGMSDRILVMRRGRVRALLDRNEATAENVVQAATDVVTNENSARPSPAVRGTPPSASVTVIPR